MSDLLPTHGSDRSVTVDGTTLSTSELLAAAGSAAEGLAGRQRVAVRATPTMETVIAVVAAVLSGTTVVLVPPDSGAAELRHILEDALPEAWLGDTPPAGELPHLATPIDARASYGRPAVDPDRVALVLYTSGTTGLPKGVKLSRRAIAACLDGLAEAWAWTEDDVVAHGLPLFHVHGLILGVLGPLRVGSGLIHVGRPTPKRYAAAARAGATVFFGVPTVWSRIADAPEHAAALRGARLLVSGSAALPVPVFERVKELTGHEVVERYGMTETLITVATRAEGPARAGWVGVPIAGVETRLSDDEGRPVPFDGESVGELQVRGATLFAGYLNRPEATAESWTGDGWFRTGDVAVIALDGSHRIVGRASVDLIKSGGFRIGAGEIESTLLGHPAVAECAVVGAPDEDLGQRIVAYVVLCEGYDASDDLAADLTAYVGTELSAHKRPREVRFLVTLPRNELGKVLKQRLSLVE